MIHDDPNCPSRPPRLTQVGHVTKHSLMLDSCRTFAVESPLMVSRAEMERIKAWLELQLIVKEQPQKEKGSE